jgi:hypothetical protein
MIESIIPTGDLESSREFIAKLQLEIDMCRQEYHEKIRRIRQRAEADERHEADRLYFNTEPLRRQMEAMIRRVADCESLKGPASPC